MNGPEALVPLTMFAGGFATIFGIYYLKTRQNLAMIERNMNPREFTNRPAPYKNLKWALLLIGAGVGLLLAYTIDVSLLRNVYRVETWGDRTYRHYEDNTWVIYFALIGIGGGVGLFISYVMEKKWWEQTRNDKQA